MARTSMEDLLGGEPEPQAPAFPRPPAEAEQQESQPAPISGAAAKPAAAGRTGRPRAKSSGERRRTARRAQGAGPKYAQMERKDARLRDDQLDGLTVLARRLTRARGKGTGEERITENTLLRVAVDVLLDNSDLLAGDTEDDLAESVTNAVRKLRTSGA